MQGAMSQIVGIFSILYSCLLIPIAGLYRWPDGDYALPMSTFGCPDQAINGWIYGYMNISFWQEFELFVPTIGTLGWSASKGSLKLFELLGPYGSHNIQLNFCGRVNDSDSDQTRWPTGKFGIYGTEQNCPSGFIKTLINITIPEVRHVNRDGFLPDIQVIQNGSNTDTLLSVAVCQRVLDNAEGPMTTFENHSFPFVLLALGDGENGTWNEPTISLRQLYIRTINKNQSVTSYKWLSFYSHYPFTGTPYYGKDIEATKTDPYFIDEYMTNATVSYPSGAHYSQGNTFRGLVHHLQRQDVWVVYDAGTNIVLSAVAFWGQFQGMSQTMEHIEVSSIYVSDMKWSFLSNGALRCLSDLHISSEYYLKGSEYTEWIMSKCFNSPSGRYVSFVYHKQTIITREMNIFFNAQFKLLFISKKSSPRCMMSMGMRNMAIQDFQLSASTAMSGNPPSESRPYGAGWCVKLTEPNPYLQIDFVSTVQVEGVQIFNWKRDFVMEPIEGYVDTYSGVYSFRIEHGRNKSELNSLQQEFYLDPFLPGEHAQTVLFISPLMTRFLVIYLVKQTHAASMKCLRFEVIGCPAKDPYTRTCSTDSKDWFSVRSLYIPAAQRNTALATVNTTSDCLRNCKDTNCVSVVYNYGNRSCQMYSQTSTMGYRHVSVDGNRAEAVLGICHAGNPMPLWSKYLSSFVELLWENKTKSNPGVLTSYGYPLYYSTGAASIWTIKVAKRQSIHLLFTRTSLTKYQIPSLYVDPCQDSILLYLSDISTLSKFWPFIQYLETGRLDNRNADMNRQAIVLQERDRQQFSLRLDQNFVHIIFKTDDETCTIDHIGNGFRVLAYASDFPTCIGEGYINEIKNYVCPWKSADIISTTFLGTFWREMDNNMWELKGDYPEYIELEILDFDVGCDTGSIFELRNNEDISRHCNKNKPLYLIRSTLTSLIVRFKVRTCGSHGLVEGFEGRYNVLTKNKDISNLAMAMDDEYSLSPKLQVKKVCAQEFNKCYVLLDLVALQSKNESMFVNVNWNIVHNTICPHYNWTMVNIHSQREQDFVGYFLHHKLQGGSQRNMYSKSDKFDYAYLGLKRNNNKYFWSDDSPLTFTSWASGHPLQNVNKDCTRADLSSLSASITWESISCYKAEADFGVCEYYITPINQHRHSSLSDLDDNPPIESSFNSTLLDMSLYFECGGGEIISFMGVCDEMMDCISGKDEEHCQSSSVCTTYQYSCYGGECVDISVLCDHFKDCPYGDDEDCYFPNCGTNMYQCESHQCIDLKLRCDGKPDCPFGEDEKSCYICNSDTSFSCGDYTCIPLAYRCDGIPDCRSEDDEKNCIKPKTCQEWWNAGYRESGMFEIYGYTLECNFDEILTTGKVITKYHAIDFLNDKGRREGDRLVLMYGSLAILDILHEEYSCYQSVDQLCQPWVQELYEVDINGTGGANSYCHCLRYVKWYHERKVNYEACDGREDINRKSVLHFPPSSKPYLEKFTLNIGGGQPGAKDTGDIRLRFNPITCYADFFPPPPDIVCGNGITAAEETRCLYDISEHGSILGCRNLMHLQKCGTFSCPDGYYKCPGSFCLKERFVCDGEKHCEHGEDEINCGAPYQVCHSKYRCLQSNRCLSLDYLCDGYRQCPLGDDERFCHFRCPYDCVCSGMTADCRLAGTNNETKVSFNTKLIDLSTNHEFFLFLNLSMTKLYYLTYLNMSSCGIKDISPTFFIHMHNLLSVDMTYNEMKVFRTEMFIAQQRLQTLFLSGNTDIHVIETGAFVGLLSLRYLEMKHAHVGYMNKNAFDGVNMTTLDLSYNVIDFIETHAFAGLSVTYMYLNETNIRTFDKGMFSGVKINQSLVTNSHKFCCIRPSELPEDSCYPLQDEFSSCSDLMRNDVLRSLLWIIGLFSLLGNAASLIYRFIFDRERLKLGYGIFVTNLAISDFLMGVYLITIASADVIFRGRYIFNDETWRGSPWCQMAGVLSTVSSEASVLFICLITLDRLLVIKYPFGQVRFSEYFSIIVSIILWGVVFIIAIVPLVITTYFKNNFYSKSGVCLALPLTRDRPPGWIYSINIFIGFNFVTFLAIAFGQWFIYTTVSAAKARVKSCSTGRANDLRVARNLLLVALTDFLCWFPIGILGILALTNHVIPGVVYAWTAVLVLPINSALNPFLYTLTAILGKKKFLPDSNEQSRKGNTNIELRENHLDVWKSKLFIQTTLADYLLPISHYMDRKGGLKLQKSLYAVGKIAKCLDFLHTRDMSPLNFTLDNIYVKQNGKRSFSIVLALHPRVLKTEEIRLEDIKHFGQLVAAVIKKHRSSFAKNIKQASRQ